MSSVQPLVDAAGRQRSPTTMTAFRAGRAPRNKGQRYPADPPPVDEIVAVMRVAGQARYGARLNGPIVVLWRRCSSQAWTRGAGRFWSGTARTTVAARSAWTLGDGRRLSHGLSSGPSCPSARCSA
jgi:hypothetical protein